ncbi:MAG: carboxypeptidase-like regulatory domain-containing protein [Bacteroidia bacterium]
MRNITKRHFSLSIFLIILCICNFAYGQSVTQTIRGKVSDQDSEAPLESAKIIVLGTNPILGAVSDENGNFRIDHVPVGRVSIRVSYLGYEDKNVPNLLLNSAKELILNISLIESIHTTEEVVIGAKQNKTEVINEMAMISSRSFSVEETKRYAGAIDDPARMVSAFAGVNGNAEGNNDIVVREILPEESSGDLKVWKSLTLTILPVKVLREALLMHSTAICSAIQIFSLVLLLQNMATRFQAFLICICEMGIMNKENIPPL